MHDRADPSGDDGDRCTVSRDNRQRNAGTDGDGGVGLNSGEPVDLTRAGDHDDDGPVHLTEPDDGRCAEDGATPLGNSDARRSEVTVGAVGEEDGPPVNVERRDGQ